MAFQNVGTFDLGTVGGSLPESEMLRILLWILPELQLARRF